jgi:hypothetical protein
MIQTKKIETAIADLKEKGKLPSNFILEEIYRMNDKIYFWGVEPARAYVWFWNERGECFYKEDVAERFVTVEDDIIKIREGLRLKRYEECDVIIDI